MITPLLEQAIQVAAKVHATQKRKGTDLPYIIHPFGVMLLAREVTDDERVWCAALLHDVLEDGDPAVYDERDMRRDFGEEVTAMVKAVTKDERIRDWRERNEDYLRRVDASGNEGAWIVCAADKVNNLTAVLRDYDAVGEQLWERFNAGREDQLWWYGACLELLERRLGGRNVLVEQLRDGVGRLWGIVKTV
jgi:(p)ppGpp synthase/HD superfamily hydrolase